MDTRVEQVVFVDRSRRVTLSCQVGGGWCCSRAEDSTLELGTNALKLPTDA
jgi:hypothetical protein